MARDKFKSSPAGGSLGAWLPFLFYAMLSLVLMMVDNRFGLGRIIRAQTSELMAPVWWLASRPYALWDSGAEAARTNAALRAQVGSLQQERLKSNLALQQMLAVQTENNELRALLGAGRRLAPRARLVEIISISPEPALKRFVIDQGARQGVRSGQVLIDAHGLAGQVAEVYAGKSQIITLTDADHAVPVIVARSGFRGILFGQGNDERLSLANLTPSDDVKAGDVLLTSGIGGRFPPGLPVGVVKTFRQDPALTFLSAQVAPFARPDYGRYLLLLEIPAAPPAAAPVSAAPSAPVPAPVKTGAQP